MARNFRPNKKGIDQLANSPELAQDLMRRMRPALEQARRTAPVSSGRLRDSHELAIEHSPSRVRVRLYNTAPYARHVATNNPWLSQALDAAAGDG